MASLGGSLNDLDGLNRAFGSIMAECRTVEEDDGAEFLSAYDDVSGAELDPKEAYKARMDEVRFIRDMKLYDKVPIKECWKYW